MKANKASSTALFISRSIAYSSKNPNLKYFVPDKVKEINERFLKTAFGWKSIVFKNSGKYFLSRLLMQTFEKTVAPGLNLYFLLRKKKIEEIILTNNLFSNTEQIVILGAGADSLGLRISEEMRSMKVFEIDHPETQKIKQKMLHNYQKEIGKNLFLIPVDLAHKKLHAVLEELENFSFDKKTIFLAEGLFMYLPLEVVKENLKIMNYFPKNKASFIFTYLIPAKNGKPFFSSQTFLANIFLKLNKEPLIWALNPEEIDGLLRSLKFSPGDHSNGEDLKKYYITDPKQQKLQIPSGEYITWAIN
ncbi:class I SAM-dependent methyltransferase [Fluviispira sanaruensis]|uniref:S-adenosyl-L-methionine-dependent methyltransferase n=1 Tax=Fluviispira sanaruensis TaxID=2493639 RepID=A0A4P2VJK5_FLUSA|nr:class I SAM-dependent methyltransferase [Fluviispira sanaruensis]BBH52891.1 SAM-dependent methyltransferase [Fluviispira sanaruensis]